MRLVDPDRRPCIGRALRGALCLGVALAARTAAAGCPAGTLETGQYRTETATAIVVHHVCTPLSKLSPAQIVTDGLEDLAAQRGWSSAKRASLAAALGNLNLPKDYIDTAGRPVSWDTIVARSDDAQLAREAAAGIGPTLWTAGEQTRYADCALYALAVAAGRPYGVVAALATQVIGEESWRTNPPNSPPLTPQQVIEQSGLNGGEMIFIAQSLGQVNVVTPDAFDRTLQAGHPIMADVTTSTDLQHPDLHEVVVTKAFTHDGAPWYELVDSYQQGALRPLYLSETELHSVLWENGVAYSPDPGRTPALLR